MEEIKKSAVAVGNPISDSFSPDNNNPILFIDWKSVCESFEKIYLQAFAISKKAHFDSLPEDWNSEEKVVDGARSKWCFPLLLDAIIFLLENDRFDLSYRRTFNQSRILQECILREVQIYYPMIFKELVISSSEKKSKRSISSEEEALTLPAESSHSLLRLKTYDRYTSSIRKGIEGIKVYTEYSQLQVCSIPRDWSDLSLLNDLLMVEPAGKSRKKYVSIVNALCHHPIFQHYQLNLLQVLKIVVCKSLLVFPCPVASSLVLLDSPRLGKKRKQSTTDSTIPVIEGAELIVNQSPYVVEEQVSFNESSFIDSDSREVPVMPTSMLPSSSKWNQSFRYEKKKGSSSDSRVEADYGLVKKQKCEFVDVSHYEASLPCQLTSISSITVIEETESSVGMTNENHQQESSSRTAQSSDDLELLQSIYYWFDSVTFSQSVDSDYYSPAIVPEYSSHRDSFDDSSHYSSSLSLNREENHESNSLIKLEDILEKMEVQTFQIFESFDFASSSMDDSVNG